MRAARTPPDPPPMTKRSTSNPFMATIAYGFGIVAEPHDGGTDRRRPPPLPGAVTDQRHTGHGGHQGEAHRHQFRGKRRDPRQEQHEDDDDERRADPAQFDPDLKGGV